MKSWQKVNWVELMPSGLLHCNSEARVECHAFDHQLHLDEVREEPLNSLEQCKEIVPLIRLCFI